MEWPGWDEPLAPPVVITGRPNRHRPRLYTEHAIPRQGLYRGPDGQLLVPIGGSHHRASSMTGVRPAQVVINNDNGVQWDDSRSDGRRPTSTHGGGRYYIEHRHYDDHDHSRRERTPSPYLDYETKQKLKELEEMKRASEDERRKRQIEEEFILQQAREEKERAERVEEEKELKKRAVEEYKLKEAEDKIKKQKQKEKEDEEFRERMRKTLWANGYSDEQIERMLRKAEKKESGHGSRGKAHKELGMARPTFVKVHRKHIDPETLDKYDLPWEWDDDDSNFIIVKQWIPEHDQETLFEHTRNLRERKQIEYTTTELKKEHDQMLLVRKKEPSRKKSPVKTKWYLTK